MCSILCALTGFYENKETNTFGKKGSKSHCYQPASDFRFDIRAKVVSVNHNASGFLIDLYPEKKTTEEQSQPL